MERVVISRPVVLCPVDFSEACGGAVRPAAAIAAYCHSDLVIATVTDPLLNMMADPRGRTAAS